MQYTVSDSIFSDLIDFDTFSSAAKYCRVESAKNPHQAFTATTAPISGYWRSYVFVNGVCVKVVSRFRPIGSEWVLYSTLYM